MQDDGLFVRESSWFDAFGLDIETIDLNTTYTGIHIKPADAGSPGNLNFWTDGFASFWS